MTGLQSYRCLRLHRTTLSRARASVKAPPPRADWRSRRQARAAVNLTANLGSDESTRARALELYDELKALAAKFPLYPVSAHATR